MATAKIVTWSRADKNDQFPIGIKVSQNGIPAYLFEGNAVASRDHWDAKKQKVKAHPHAMRLTNFLIKRLAEVNEKILEFTTERRAFTAEDIVNAIKEKLPREAPAQSQQKAESTVPVVLFKDVADNYLAEQKALGNYDVYKTDKARLKRFYEFSSEGKIPFSDITVEFLRRYIICLRQAKQHRYNEKSPIKPLSERTITNHLVPIRTIYNRAITAKLTNNDTYPFGENGIVIKFGKSAKIGLDDNEISALENLDLSKHLPLFNDARNAWLIEYFFAGMRATDCFLLKWTDFQNGRLYYQMSKNGEHGSVKIPPKVLPILEQYRDQENDLVNNKHNLVFPFLKHVDDLENRFELRRQIASKVNRLNKTMAKLMKMIGSTKNATQHKARHSFAQRAEEKQIHPKVLQKLYRHESIETTMNYQSNFSFGKLDDAMDTVVGL